MTDRDASSIAIELPHGDYHRVIVSGDDGDSDFLKAADKLARAIHMRDAYKEIDKGQLEDYSDFTDESHGRLRMIDGIYHVSGLVTLPVPWSTYVSNVRAVFDLLEVGPWFSTAKTRLNVLSEKFELYKLLNADVEAQYDNLTGGGGIHSSSVKVDNNVRLTTAMTAQALVDYIHHTAVTQGDEPVKHEFGVPVSLLQVLEAYGIPNPTTLTVEGLGLHPLQRKRFNEFDILDPRSNTQVAEVLRLFLQTKGTINQGKFFAGLVRPLLESRERESNHRRGHARIATEYKIQVNGYTRDEWMRQAAFLKNCLQVSYAKNRWVVHIQRRECDRADTDCVTNEDQLRHIFEPMFIATMEPSNPEYAVVAEVLKAVGAVNITSDEAFRSTNLHDQPRAPASIPWSECPDDYYFFYYVWANLCTLNALRKKKGLNTIQFRPTCGESTPHWDQIVCSYLLADSIAQGIKLENSSVMQYLYLMGRIGICMSPISNNAACFFFKDNPFLPMFKCGLLVSLSTDNPLHYHHAAEPLLEEYATAQKMFHLSATDMSEIARNSVIISSFSDEQKLEWIGSIGWEGGGSKRSHVCDFRLHFRHDCLLHEQALLNYVLHQAAQMSQVPLTTSLVSKFSKASSASSVPPRIPERRRQHLLDTRVTFPRISAGNRISSPRDYRDAVLVMEKMLQLRHKYIGPVLQEAAKGRTVRVEDVFRKDHIGFVPDPETSDDDCSSGAPDFSASVLLPQQSGVAQDQPFGVSFDPSLWTYAMYYGVCLISRCGTAPTWPSFVPEFSSFLRDVDFVCDKVQNDVMLDILSRLRLQVLEHRFRLHLAMNIGRESGQLKEKDTNNRDFYAARKVDNNVHTEACMNARILFHFFTEKVKQNGDDVVMERDGLPVTLRRVVAEQGVNVHRLTVDELTGRLAWSARDPEANENVLKEIFLKTDNYMRGRYFAELTKLVFENNKLDETCFSEMRLEIRGESIDEWATLADWVDRYGMISAQNRWMIRFSRNFSYLRKNKPSCGVTNFGQYLENIFTPLWEASLRPAENTKLHYLLFNVSGFDFVGDETEVDLDVPPDLAPLKWTSLENPSYAYYAYYLWVNIVTLNSFRKARGLSTWTFRPQCGEAGGIQHLAVGFLLGNSINQGITLSRFPIMEYAFYLAQTGISMSPLSNTDRTVAYLDNPFPRFYMRGLNVSLSSNVPLLYHFTSEPLIEELSVASKIWVLSNNDLAELSRNSVLQSGFPRRWKKEALGPLYNLRSTLGNDVTKSHISDVRVAFRYEAYHTELDFLDSILMTSVALRNDESGEVDAATLRLPRSFMSLPLETARYQRFAGTVKSGPEALDRLREIVESLNNDINEARQALQDTIAQNHAMACDIIRLAKRAEDAQKESMVIQAALIPNDWIETPASDIEMVELLLKSGVPLHRICAEIGCNTTHPWRELGLFLEGRCTDIDLRRKLLAYLHNKVVSNVLDSVSSVPKENSPASSAKRQPAADHRASLVATDTATNGELVVFLLEAGFNVHDVAHAMHMTGALPAASVTTFLYGRSDDQIRCRTLLVETAKELSERNNALQAALLSDDNLTVKPASPAVALQRTLNDADVPLTNAEIIEALLSAGMSLRAIADSIGFTLSANSPDFSIFALQQSVADASESRSQLLALYRKTLSPPVVNTGDAPSSPAKKDLNPSESITDASVSSIASPAANEEIVLRLLLQRCPIDVIAEVIGFDGGVSAAQDLTLFLEGKASQTRLRRAQLVNYYSTTSEAEIGASPVAAPSSKAPQQATVVEMVAALLHVGLKLSDISTAMGFSSSDGVRDVSLVLAAKSRDMASRRFKLEQLYENRVRRRP